MIDSSSSEEKLYIAKNELYKAVSHHQLKSLPLLILATFQDKEGARSTEEVSLLEVFNFLYVVY